MANTPISGFTSGAPAQSTDEFVIARSGANFKLAGSDIKTLIIGAGSASIASGKTLTVNNTLTLSGTDGTTMTFPTTSATLARTDAGNTFTGNQVVSSGSFGLSGNISRTAWTTSGARYANVAATLTDTSSTGTVATAYTDVFGGNTIAASNSTTFTNYYTSWFSPPTAGTNVTFTGRWAMGLGGSLDIQAGTVTTNTTPALNLTQTWNAAGVTFTGLRFNATDTASASASLLLDLQVGGVSQFSVTKAGLATIGSIVTPNGGSNTVTIQSSFSTTTAFNFVAWNGASIGWASGAFVNNSSTPDTILRRAAAASLQLGAADVDGSPVAQTLGVQSVTATTTSNNVAGANLTIAGSRGSGSGAGGSIIFQVAPAGSSGNTRNALVTQLQINGAGGITGQDGATANTLALRNGTSAQTFNIYNTYTSGTSYERFSIIAQSGGAVQIGTNKGSGGGTARNLEIQTDGTTQLIVDTAGMLDFAGSTSSFPALKRSSATLQVRLADDSAFAQLTASSVLAAGATGVIGYTTGSGGAVTQATSRTTGVTLDKSNGQITLVSAAGTATWQSFTVTNSTVAATDTVIVNQDSGTDLYQISVTNVAAGSFQITFATTGGTTTEQPVFSFAVIKAVAA